MKKLSLFLMLVMFGFGLMVQTAQAADITSAPDLLIDEKNSATGPLFNARYAISPYAQVVPNSTYTFIGISHPSLATAHTSIGVAVEAIDMTTVPDNASGRAAVFTIDAGTTHRVFIVNNNHATINTNNSLFTDSQTHLIVTPATDQFGSIRVTGIGTSPTIRTTNANRPGDYRTSSANAVTRWDNVAQLAMWGVVYQSSNGAGFALEFIGDMHDPVSGSSPGGGYHVGVGVTGKTREYGLQSEGFAIDVSGATGGGRGIN